MWNSKGLIDLYYSENKNPNEEEASIQQNIMITVSGLIGTIAIGKPHPRDLLMRDDNDKILQFPNKKLAIKWLIENIEDKYIHPLDKQERAYLLQKGYHKQFYKK